MEGNQCVSIKIDDDKIIFKDIVSEMKDFDTFASNEKTCLTNVDPVEMLKNNPKRPALKKTCMKQTKTNALSNCASEGSEDNSGQDSHDNVNKVLDNRRVSCLSWTAAKEEKKKDSLASESDVFEKVHLDTSGHVPMKEKIVTGLLKYLFQNQFHETIFRCSSSIYSGYYSLLILGTEYI